MFIGIMIGSVIGVCGGIVLLALLNGNRADEMEEELRQTYTAGYDNGYEAGYSDGASIRR